MHIIPRKMRMFLIAALVLVATPVWADIQVAGNTSGSQFYWFLLPVGSQVLDLSYTSLSFGPSTLAVGQTLTLGTFSLPSCSNCNQDYSSYSFDLHLAFSQPAGTGGTWVVADVDGSLKTNSQGHGQGGGADITFSNTPVVFDFGSNSSFSLVVNDVSVTYPGSTNLTGTVTAVSGVASPVPEPGSILLLGTLVAGVGFCVKKRQSRPTQT